MYTNVVQHCNCQFQKKISTLNITLSSKCMEICSFKALALSLRLSSKVVCRYYDMYIILCMYSGISVKGLSIRQAEVAENSVSICNYKLVTMPTSNKCRWDKMCLFLLQVIFFGPWANIPINLPKHHKLALHKVVIRNTALINCSTELQFAC